MIHFVNAPCGAGKTYAFCEYAHSLAAAGGKVLFVQPTTELIEKTYGSIRAWEPFDYQLKRIHSANGIGSTIGRIIEHLKNAVDGGEILLITHAAFFNIPFFSNKRDWTVLIDEIPGIYEHIPLRIPETHNLLTESVTTVPDGPKYVRVLATNTTVLTKIADNRLKDDGFEFLRPTARRLIGRSHEVFGIDRQFIELTTRQKTDGRLDLFFLLRPIILSGFKEVVIAGANLTDSLLYRDWSNKHVAWCEHKEISSGLRYMSHSGGGLLSICHFGLTNWSKHRRDSLNLLPDMMKIICGLVGKEPFLWLGNKDIDDIFRDFPGQKQLPYVPHGRNDFQSYNKVVVLSALNPEPSVFSFLRERGLSGPTVVTALTREAVYQAIMRSSLRDPSNVDQKLVIVPDKPTAVWLQSLFPESSVHLLDGLTLTQTVPKNVGRRKIYSSNGERQKAYRLRKIMTSAEGVSSK